jgi:hypothetical protein
MEEDAIRIGKENNCETINLGSAARVLMALENDDLDIGVIGRKAKAREFSGYRKQLAPGFTLITTSKMMIDKDQLPGVEIHTNIEKSIIDNQFSELTNIRYHKTLDEALQNGLVQLINWDDWNDAFNLLIPVDQSYNKVRKYRTPFVFSKNQELLDSIK